jgi:hypothetical protein
MPGLNGYEGAWDLASTVPHEEQHAGWGRRALAEVRAARREIRQGRFQRTMALMTGFAAVVSGFEAYVQHQRGAFANKWMWTPVLLTLPVVGAAGAALVSEEAARRTLPVTAGASLLDGLIGFGYHLRGIARLPGGFKLGRYNVVMGPPIFAPLLVGTVGVLGLLASALRPEDWAVLLRPILRQDGAADQAARLVSAALNDGGSRYAGHLETHTPGRARKTADLPAAPVGLEEKISHGRFQKVMAGTAAGFAVLAGGEAYFEHLRGSYNQAVMWTPVLVTPPMLAAGAGAIRSEVVAQQVLPWVSLVTFLDGLLGFGLHLRGLKRMPGGFGNLGFNSTMGPPLFAPLLFCAVGLLGFIAALLRRGRP